MSLARVLVVDDDPDVLDLVMEIMTLAGYEVVTATGAGDVLMLAQVAAPDVSLLDIAMPGMDGVTALQRLRALRPEAAVIMLTANQDDAVGRKALRRGAFDYIAKPFAAARLEEVVAAAVGHPRS